MIQKLTGAELFEAEPVVPYSDDYSACIEEAKNDKKRDARPELKKYPEHMESFEKIYLGYPNYWGTMPMAMFTLLEHFDFAGKTILPFCTHEGSGLGDTSAISDVCAPAPTCGPAWPSPAPAPRRQKRKLKSGF